MKKFDEDAFIEKIAKIDERTENLVSTVNEIKSRLDSSYVTQKEFEPIKKIVYGLVGLILTTVMIALLYLVVNKGG